MFSDWARRSFKYISRVKRWKFTTLKFLPWFSRLIRHCLYQLKVFARVACITPAVNARRCVFTCQFKIWETFPSFVKRMKFSLIYCLSISVRTATFFCHSINVRLSFFFVFFITLLTLTLIFHAFTAAAIPFKCGKFSEGKCFCYGRKITS